jgi:hypothetical protein
VLDCTGVLVARDASESVISEIVWHDARRRWRGVVGGGESACPVLQLHLLSFLQSMR